MHLELRKALVALYEQKRLRKALKIELSGHGNQSERQLRSLTFYRHYKKIGFLGYPAYSGRRYRYLSNTDMLYSQGVKFDKTSCYRYLSNTDMLYLAPKVTVETDVIATFPILICYTGQLNPGNLRQVIATFPILICYTRKLASASRF